MWLRRTEWIPGRIPWTIRRPHSPTGPSHPHDRFDLGWPTAIAHSGIADQRPAWSCAEQNPFSECREDSERQGKSEELPWVLRRRMATAAASIGDASVSRPEGRPLRLSATGRSASTAVLDYGPSVASAPGKFLSHIMSIVRSSKLCWRRTTYGRILVMATRRRPAIPPEAIEAKAAWHRAQASLPIRDKVRILLELQRHDLPLIRKRRVLRSWEKPWPIEP
jgi:hypothetical protein